jgi:alpha-mannosidase
MSRGVAGGMWVESDQLLPSGESLARQFLYGQRYFHSRFGQYCKTWWLPDSFGYNSASPQIARLAGLEFFFTQKLSWSRAFASLALQRLPSFVNGKRR